LLEDCCQSDAVNLFLFFLFGWGKGECREGEKKKKKHKTKTGCVRHVGEGRGRRLELQHGELCWLNTAILIKGKGRWTFLHAHSPYTVLSPPSPVV
jgi:hypothetical protein